MFESLVGSYSASFENSQLTSFLQRTPKQEQQNDNPDENPADDETLVHIKSLEHENVSSTDDPNQTPML